MSVRLQKFLAEAGVASRRASEQIILTARVKVNGKVVQKGDLSELIWNIPETISYLSKLITLRPGDLIYSGTPAGVGPVNRGDNLEGHVDGVGDLTVTYEK